MFLAGILTLKKKYALQPWVNIKVTKTSLEKTVIIIVKINLPMDYAFDLSTQVLSFNIFSIYKKNHRCCFKIWLWLFIMVIYGATFQLQTSGLEILCHL